MVNQGLGLGDFLLPVTLKWQDLPQTHPQALIAPKADHQHLQFTSNLSC